MKVKMHIFLIVIIIILTLNLLSPYLFKSIISIKRNILRTTPIDMNINDVYYVLKNDKKYKNWYIQVNNFEPKKGDTVIKGLDYGLPPYIGVSWEFDDDGKLILINIRKYWTP